MYQFRNFVVDPEILMDKPIIISFELIMEWLGTGGTPAIIVAKHPLLKNELVLEAIRYAARFAKSDPPQFTNPKHIPF